ncbi:antibiotic acetyltransferase [Pedobacter miscanthi]|uniref:Antibiotic acetyltransferase n=1 Tax=Pedobacter miscanthi TaxID=2259170 RepID=A0A366LA26_9SPHI|nr:antibiotic acetyltransferase [Pedobacter miscanthi]
MSIGRNSYLYQTQIGRYTYLSQSVSIMNTKIGGFCSIAQNVLIGGGMHPSNTFASTSPAFYSIYQQCGKTFADKSYFKEMGNVVIGNDVWIGANVVIMDDVTIGDGAIIGAGAIVTKDVKPYSIVVGTPAKHLKYRFETEQIDFLLEFKWWLKDEAWLTENYKDLHNIISLVEKYKK